MSERLDHFMARANAAYYATRDPFADFTTAPEISQVFGELLGLWLATQWDAQGRPAPASLVEAGPGRGTLMRDARRAIAQAAPAFAAAPVHLIETSAALRARQAALLPDAHWHDRLDGVPGIPFLVANEFLDALPIRQFVRTAAGLVERHVTDGRLLPAAEPASIVERGEAACVFVATLAARIARGGAALLIDYGPAESAAGDSLQALRDGRFADPLADPGSADLTAHVDFAALADAARAAGAAVHGPVPQGKFLAELGLFQRTDRLARGRPPAAAHALLEAAQRLAEPAAMGRLFKVLALTPAGSAVPPGFA